MLKGIQIIRLGVIITAISLIITHTVGLPHEFTAFFMGLGCSLSLVGAGKRFVEIRA
ncbi:hypothetical protein [Paenibacillus albiflavus]|uniref:hypothetical protein n=1 Tax=Paenibacillus albiflavus TaxID=2545760 RepID=UPI001404E7AE|nr:hypothetical protein [Paenibacillus albiflavus]